MQEICEQIEAGQDLISAEEFVRLTAEKHKLELQEVKEEDRYNELLSLRPSQLAALELSPREAQALQVRGMAWCGLACSVVLCTAVLCSAVFYRVVVCYAIVLCCVVSCCVVSCCVVLWSYAVPCVVWCGVPKAL